MRRAAVGLMVCLTAAGLARAAPAARAAPDLARYVNPFSGTDSGAPDFGTGGGGANTSPAAVVPFGMVQWGPDSWPSSTNFAGGYTYRDSQLRGFSLTHLSGAGCPAYQDVRFLPTSAELTGAPVLPGSAAWTPTLLPAFSHAQELAQPGYYRVLLDPGAPAAIDTELTATTRTGSGRITYPASGASTMLINAGASAAADGDAGVLVDPARQEVTGVAASGRFCRQRNAYRVYFAARFDRPFDAYGTWRGQALSPMSTSSSDHAGLAFGAAPQPDASPDPSAGTAQAGAYVSFDTSRQATVQVKVGLSYVSIDGARQNLDAENPGWNFATVRSRATRAWNDLLGRAEVSGGTAGDTQMFYTALYHALLAPHVFSDSDGLYAGMDGTGHRAVGYTQYADFSGWDVYRSEIPLLAMLAPERAAEMMQSLLADARESGCLPRWPLANGQSNVMVGDPSDPMLASADAFGAGNFDRRDALQRMTSGANRACQSTVAGPYVERPGLAAYLKLGYVPAEQNTQSGNRATARNPAAVWGAAATTLEYATDDYAIAQLAARLGERATARTFLARSRNWRRLFHPATGHVQQRSASGRFRADHPASGVGFVEGNGGQYTWAVPQDLAGLFRSMGGQAAARRHLDAFMTQLNAGPRSNHAFLGNEPTLETPWEYDWLGEPSRTQRLVRTALRQLYNPSPTGYPGNDDLGQMSSWYLFGALGMYPEVPGTDVLALGSPLFPRTTLHLAHGDLVIDAPGASDASPYVRGLTLNGTCVDQPWLRYAWLARGGHLSYALTSTPNTRWGAAASAAPPSGHIVDQVGPRPCRRPPP